MFGNIFVNNNKDKCTIAYSGKEKELCTFLYDIPKDNNGLFEIKLQGIKNLTNINFMFNGCTQLVSSPDISKIQISESPRSIFCGCLSLQSLPDISHWKELICCGSSGYNFFCCSSLTDLIGFEEEDINEVGFHNFDRCLKLIKNIKNRKKDSHKK